MSRTIFKIGALVLPVGLAACGVEGPYTNEGVMGRWPLGSTTSFMLPTTTTLRAATTNAMLEWDTALAGSSDCFRIRATDEGGFPVVYSPDPSGLGLGYAQVNIGGDGYLKRCAIFIDPRAPEELYGYLMLHEMGHCLGLNHSTDPDAAMYPGAHAMNKLADDDIARIQELYGADRWRLVIPLDWLDR